MCRNYPRDNWQYLKKIHNLQQGFQMWLQKIWNVQKVGRFLLRKKSNGERKLIRRQRCIKAMRKKKSCPSEIYELQPLPVCVLCCLMAAVVSDWQCANATHSVQTCQSREEGRKKNNHKKKKIQNTKWKCTLRPAEEGSIFLSLLAWTPKNKMLSAST